MLITHSLGEDNLPLTLSQPQHRKERHKEASPPTSQLEAGIFKNDPKKNAGEKDNLPKLSLKITQKYSLPVPPLPEADKEAALGFSSAFRTQAVLPEKAAGASSLPRRRAGGKVYNRVTHLEQSHISLLGAQKRILMLSLQEEKANNNSPLCKPVAVLPPAPKAGVSRQRHK